MKLFEFFKLEIQMSKLKLKDGDVIVIRQIKDYGMVEVICDKIKEKK